MKAFLLSLVVALLMVGCGESSTPSDPVDPVESPKAIDLDDKETRDKIIAEAIDRDKLQKRGTKGEELYAPNEQTPYTGWAKSMHENGQVSRLQHYMNGKMDGLFIAWYENGQKEKEVTLKDGKMDGLWTDWCEYGQKRREMNWKDGEPNGLTTIWNENGQKEAELNFKDDQIISILAWKPNGEKCPVTNVKNGNGVWIRYNEDGTELFRSTYKDSELVRATP